MLIYIEDKELQTKIISYLDYVKTDYTLDLNDIYDTVIIAQVNKNTKEIIKNKKVIFITYLEEEKIYKNFTKNNKKSRSYKIKIMSILKKCNLIITSIEGIKSLLLKEGNLKIEVIPKEIPVINISKNNKEIYERYNISKRKKKIIIIDKEYNNLEYLDFMTNKYPKYQFIYIGFTPDYKLTKKDKNMLYNLSSSVIKIKYIDLNIFSDLLKMTDFVISFDNLLLDIEYFYVSVILKKQLLCKETILYNPNYINSKNIYFFNDIKDLDLKFGRMINHRIANLTDETYEEIKDNTFENIAKKYSIYLH